MAKDMRSGAYTQGAQQPRGGERGGGRGGKNKIQDTRYKIMY